MLETTGSMRIQGFTYIGLLFAVALMGIALAMAGQVWSTLDRRAKEQQLLFIGAQFRDALQRYYSAAPAGARRVFPQNLNDLLRDARYPDTRRYLRKVYADPLTGDTQWGVVRMADGGIVGVYSRAPGVPIRSDVIDYGFRFAGRKSYSEWIFGVGGGSAVTVTLAGTPPTSGTGGAQIPAIAATESSPIPQPPAGASDAEHKKTCGILAANDLGACFYAERIHGAQVGAACRASAASRSAQCLNYQPFSVLVIR